MRKDLELQLGDLVYTIMKIFWGGFEIRKLKKLKARYTGPYPFVEWI